MSNLWLKFRIWTKVIAFVTLLVYALIFIYKNSETRVRLWFFYNTAPDLSVLVLVSCAFLVGVLAAILVRTTVRTIRQIRDLRERSRSDRLEREVADMQTKAAKLRSRTDGAGTTVAAEDPLP